MNLTAENEAWFYSKVTVSSCEIGEPRPDMNNKVAAFTVSQKLYKLSTRILAHMSLVLGIGKYI